MIFWSIVFFTFVLYGYLGPVVCRPGDDPVNDWNRQQLVNFVYDDPCSKGGFWFFIEEPDRAKAVNKCKQAYTFFIALNLPEEKSACPHATMPDCRNLPTSENIIRGCTFMCGYTEIVYIPRSDGLPGHQRVIQTNFREMHLPVIVRRMFNNLRAAHP